MAASLTFGTRGGVWRLYYLLLPPLLLLLLLPNIVWSKPGEYFTVPILLNKRLPRLMDTENTASKEECEKICQNNARCNAYAISEFEANCILYDNDRSNLPVKFNNYILYVLRLMEKDGYYVHKTDYYKLFTKRMTAHRAAEYCKNKEQGTLATVKSEKVNNLLLARIVEHNVWTAFIGVSDIEKEEDWRYADGSEVDYSNWSTSGGKWPSVRRDCAIITITGEWKHADCWHKDFFICQIPMF